MAFPFLFEENFESGGKGGFDTETDTDSILDFPHISTLAQLPWSQCAPFRGAYVARVTLAGGTNDATLTEGDIDIADGATASFRWYMYFGTDFAFTADDVVTLFEVQSAGPTTEVTFGLQLTAATQAIRFGAGDGAAAATFGSKPIQLNKWHCFEAQVKVSTAGAGTVTGWLDGVQQVALTSQTHAGAVIQGKLGVSDQLATTTGTVLFDQFVMDDTRIYPIVDRYPTSLLLTKSSHVFVGPGCIDAIALYSGAATDNVATVYDTNRANTSDAYKIGVEVKNTSNSEVVEPVGSFPLHLRRGCYVSLTGTNPRALVSVGCAPGYSAASSRFVAQRLRTRSIEVL